VKQRSPRQQAQVERLLLSFTRKSKRGGARYSKQDRHRLIELLLVTLVPPARHAHLPPQLQRIMGRLSIKAKVDKVSSPDAAMRGLQAYFQKHPPSPAILRDFNDALRKLNAEVETNAAKSRRANRADARSDMCQPTPAMLSPAATPKVADDALTALLPSSLENNRQLAIDNIRLANRFVR